MNQWTPNQRRQQISEMLRNKGILCRDFLLNGKCPRSPTCPYMHVHNGETRPIPWSVCTFFNQGVCLRDRCAFFHGTQQQLDELRASGAEVYQPQQYMRVAVPPREFLNPDGTIAVDNVPIPAPQPAQTFAAPPPPTQPQQPMQIYQSLQPVMMLPQPSTLVSAPQIPQVQYHYIQQPQQQQLSTYMPQQPQPTQQPQPQPPLQQQIQPDQQQQQPIPGYTMAMNTYSGTTSGASISANQIPSPHNPQHQYYQPQNSQQLFFQVPQQPQQQPQQLQQLQQPQQQHQQQQQQQLR